MHNGKRFQSLTRTGTCGTGAQFASTMTSNHLESTFRTAGTAAPVWIVTDSALFIFLHRICYNIHGPVGAMTRGLSSLSLLFLFPLAGRGHAWSAPYPAKAAGGQRGEKVPFTPPIGTPEPRGAIVPASRTAANRRPSRNTTGYTPPELHETWVAQ